MIICSLCLTEKQSSQKCIEVHSEIGKNMKAADILCKHFDFFVEDSLSNIQKICGDCWNIVLDFHKLYEIVNATQSVLKNTKAFVAHNVTSGVDCDPLPHEISNSGEKSGLELITGNEFFCPEIKIEEDELDRLPKIEIIESGSNFHIQDLTPTTEKCTLIENSDNEDEPSNSFEEEILNQTILCTDIDNDSQQLLVKRKRGRPQKKKEQDSNSSVIKKDSKKSVRSTQSSDGDENNDNFDASVSTFEEASQSSRSDTFHENSGTESESSSHHQYAVIPKRVSARPKKYKKRSKPILPAVRMTPEEIRRRKEQQEEYDQILAKFFNNKFACPICNLLVLNFTDMLRHQRVTHMIDAGFMNCCGRKFKSRKALAEHVLIHWNPDHFKCNVCSKLFQGSRLLEIHQRSHTKTDDIKETAIFQCDKCPKTFSNKSTFEYHKLTKHVPKSEFKFTCPECNKKLLTERKLKNHIKAMHDPENAIICDKCGKQMRTKHSLKKHQELLHSNEPRPEPVLMQCQICGTWLKNVSGLKQHMKSIHIEAAGEHRCPVCNKVSPNARALRRHIYHNHECERKFKCTMCEKAFKRPQELREHTSTHTGEVLYTCPNCPMTFFCSANMYKHRQRLHREQYEADKNQPRPPNILQQAVGATAAMKVKLMQNNQNSTTNTFKCDPDVKYF